MPPSNHELPPATTHAPGNHACPLQPCMPISNHTCPPATMHAPRQLHMPPQQTRTPLWTEWQTGVKILPCPKLRLRAVIKPVKLYSSSLLWNRHKTLSDEFSRNYTKLTVLSFVYCFAVKGKLISAKCFLQWIWTSYTNTLVFWSQCLSICARSPSVNWWIFNLTFVSETFRLRGTERI